MVTITVHVISIIKIKHFNTKLKRTEITITVLTCIHLNPSDIKFNIQMNYLNNNLFS